MLDLKEENTEMEILSMDEEELWLMPIFQYTEAMHISTMTKDGRSSRTVVSYGFQTENNIRIVNFDN